MATKTQLLALTTHLHPTGSSSKRIRKLQRKAALAEEVQQDYREEALAAAPQGRKARNKRKVAEREPVRP